LTLTFSLSSTSNVDIDLNPNLNSTIDVDVERRRPCSTSTSTVGFVFRFGFRSMTTTTSTSTYPPRVPQVRTTQILEHSGDRIARQLFGHDQLDHHRLTFSDEDRSSTRIDPESCEDREPCTCT